MRIRPFLLAAGLSVMAGVAIATPAMAIRGGLESPQPYPFLGSLQRPDSPRADGHVCGVTLVAPQWVVTAGHCARNPSGAQTGTPRDWRVRVGSLSTTSGGEVAAVDKFYSYSTRPVAEGDIALLHLAAPLRAKPIALPAQRPADGAPTRIVGWGVTCSQPQAQCYPDHLREADTVIQPTAICERSGITSERELCVGAEDGSVAATDLDSGGPALVRTGDEWTIAGTVSGSNDDDQAVVYTDVHWFRSWLTGIISGASVPPETPVPNLEGSVSFGGCSASVVRTSASRPTDPALLLTNGHCAGPTPPAPGTALIDQPVDQLVRIGNRQGYPQTSARLVRLVYATMTGTDVALFRLDKTYGQIHAAGAKVFVLGTKPAHEGTRLDIVAAGAGKRFTCKVAAVVTHLREAEYQMDKAYRYEETPPCAPTHGTSGSPLVAADGITVVGVHNTGNDDGEQCTTNNPCEVSRTGTVTVRKGSRYGQRTTMVPACLTTGSRLDLFRRGCTLTRPHSALRDDVQHRERG